MFASCKEIGVVSLSYLYSLAVVLTVVKQAPDLVYIS